MEFFSLPFVVFLGCGLGRIMFFFGCIIYFLTNHAWLSLHPIISNYTFLSSSKFISKVSFHVCLMNMEIRATRAFV
jgi:hypothetical protein